MTMIATVDVAVVFGEIGGEGAGVRCWVTVSVSVGHGP